MYSRLLRNSLIWVVVLVGVVAVVYTLMGQTGSSKLEVPLCQFVESVKQGQVSKVEIDRSTVNFQLTSNDQQLKTKLEKNTTVYEALNDNGVPPEDSRYPKTEIKSGGFPWGPILTTFLPLLLFGGLLFFIMRQAQGTNSQAMNFGKSRARMFTGTRPGVTFLAVAGVDEAKEELQEVGGFLKWPEKFVALGARIPRGVLLLGPPGTGQTLLAKAGSGEAGA